MGEFFYLYKCTSLDSMHGISITAYLYAWYLYSCAAKEHEFHSLAEDTIPLKLKLEFNWILWKNTAEEKDFFSFDCLEEKRKEERKENIWRN